MCDPRGGVHFWRVRAGVADDWDLPPTHACGPAPYVTIPPIDHCSGPLTHWLDPPAVGRCLTDGILLRGALLAALVIRPHPAARLPERYETVESA